MFSCSHLVLIKTPNTIVEESSGKKDRRRACGGCIEKPERETISSLDPGASHSPGNQGQGQNSIFTSTEKSFRNRVQNTALSSQEWQRDDNPFSCAGKPMRGIQNQLTQSSNL